MRAPLAVVVTLVSLASLGAARVAQAGACCGDGSALGARLAQNERAAFVLGLEHRERYGGLGGSGVWKGLATGDAERALRADVSFAVRLAGPLELGGTAPMHFMHRSLGGLRDEGGGPGDVSLLARARLVSPTRPDAWPGVFLTATVVLPTGRSASQSKSALGADVTGQGLGEVRPVLSLEKAWKERWFARVSGGAGVQFGQSAPSPRVMVSALTGPVFGWGSLGAGLEHERQEPSAAGASGRARTSALAAAMVSLPEAPLGLANDLSLVSALRVDLPTMGSNETTHVALSLGLRLAFYGGTL